MGDFEYMELEGWSKALEPSKVFEQIMVTDTPNMRACWKPQISDVPPELSPGNLKFNRMSRWLQCVTKLK